MSKPSSPRKVGVAPGHRTVDGGGVDVDGDLRRLRTRPIDHNASAEQREAGPHEREHRVARDELERRMRRVDLPITGG
jgi:hypothetical protein